MTGASLLLAGQSPAPLRAGTSLPRRGKGCDLPLTRQHLTNRNICDMFYEHSLTTGQLSLKGCQKLADQLLKGTTMAIETKTMRLPVHWASALINGDMSGVDDDDDAAMGRMMEDLCDQHPDADAFTFVDVADEPHFARYHDAEPYGVLACDVSDFTLMIHSN